LLLKQVAPDYVYHAADRTLGKLYHEAPAFISYGSSKKARAHYQAAVLAEPNYPGNQLFFAEFLEAQGEHQAAKEHVQLALNSPLLEKLPIERDEWRRMANELSKKIGESLKP
jgi:tetratricopeptide (TPR) repeat protein